MYHKLPAFSALHVACPSVAKANGGNRDFVPSVSVQVKRVCRVNRRNEAKNEHTRTITRWDPA